MRKILAILIIIIVGFWVVYGLVPPVKTVVDSLFINYIGPRAYDTANTAYTQIIASSGVGGFAAMVLAFGFVIGIIVHLLWVKADWKIRRWGHARTSKDLGVSPVTPITTTPVTATTRPTVATSPTPEAPVVTEEPEPEKKE